MLDTLMHLYRAMVACACVWAIVLCYHDICSQRLPNRMVIPGIVGCWLFVVFYYAGAFNLRGYPLGVNPREIDPGSADPFAGIAATHSQQHSVWLALAGAGVWWALLAFGAARSQAGFGDAKLAIGLGALASIAGFRGVLVAIVISGLWVPTYRWVMLRAQERPVVAVPLAPGMFLGTAVVLGWAVWVGL